MHALRALGLPRLRAVHVDHGLQADSAAWAQACRAKARRWGIPCDVIRVAVAANGSGPEAAARAARHAAFESVTGPGDLLVLAHHRADQVETVLQRVLRGAGPEGLAGMRRRQRIGGLRAWRPLLDCPPEVLAAYARRHRLGWIEDPHNRELRFQRVALRRVVLPAWRELDPKLDDRVLALAADCRRIATGLATIGDEALERVQQGGTLCLDTLAGLEPLAREQALREWPRRHGLQPMPGAQIRRVLDELVAARGDAEPQLRWDGHRVRRYRRRLYLVPELPPVEAAGVPCPVRARQRLPAGAGRLRVVADAALRARIAWCFPSGGERLRPAGEAHTRTLKQLFQRHGVPPWVRRRTPLLWLDGELACVPGCAESEAFRELREAGRLSLRWRHALLGAPRGNGASAAEQQQ